MHVSNIFQDIPASAPQELVDALVSVNAVRIERIVSTGQCSPPGFWYDQEEDEWVLVLSGAARLQFDDGHSVAMNRGDFLVIPAHQRHRVEWTTPTETTVWLAVFYRANEAMKMTESASQR